LNVKVVAPGQKGTHPSGKTSRRKKRVTVGKERKSQDVKRAQEREKIMGPNLTMFRRERKGPTILKGFKARFEVE